MTCQAKLMSKMNLVSIGYQKGIIRGSMKEYIRRRGMGMNIRLEVVVVVKNNEENVEVELEVEVEVR